MKKLTIIATCCLLCVTFASCEKQTAMQKKVREYAPFRLTSDLLDQLSDNEKKLIPIFIEISDLMDRMFWRQTFGDKNAILSIEDKATREFALINYGPWDRLNNNEVFVSGYYPKPLGARYYPSDITKEEYDAFDDLNKGSQYTIIRRNPDGTLQSIWYRKAFFEELARVDWLLDDAIELADDPGLKNYLTKRREAFLSDDYFESDMAWMDMKDSKLDFVFGPIETYDDKLNEAKASYEAYILLKDVERSKELEKFVAMLPELQKQLPGDDKYKTFVPGTSSDLNVYDAIYYAGDCNAGSKTIAINLPNDDRVQALKGARRLQLRNSMLAKFDKIMVPIGEIILEPEQQKNLKFDAFFWNVTFHEVAHGLGIKETINGKGSVDDALKTEKTSWEEAKADILGLFLTCKLIEMGEITNITVEDAITTYITGLLRSVRFGAASSHGKANMMCYNYMQKEGAFARNTSGKYHIDFKKAKEAINSWGALILKTQGEGDYDFALKYREENGGIGQELQADLDKINSSDVPRDIRFIQGLATLGMSTLDDK